MLCARLPRNTEPESRDKYRSLAALTTNSTSAEEEYAKLFKSPNTQRKIIQKPETKLM